MGCLISNGSAESLKIYNTHRTNLSKFDDSILSVMLIVQEKFGKVLLTKMIAYYQLCSSYKNLSKCY